MSLRTRALFLVVLATLAATSLVNCKRRPKDRCGVMVKVLAASGTITPGTPLSIDVVEEREIPEEFFTDSMLTQGDLELNRRRLIVHRMEKGTPIYFFNLEGHNKKSVGQRIRPGGRGYPLRLEAGAELEEWLQEFDHVDVLATVPLQTGGPGEYVTITLLENLAVLSVATPKATADGNTPGPVTVVLLVLPEEAELLHQAETTGKVSLTVRNPDDRTLLQERAWSTHKTLFTRERMKKSPAQAPTDPPPAVPPPGK